jgi:hypothetical protein
LTHAEDHAPILGYVGALQEDAFLCLNCALYCIHGASKLDQQNVPSRSDQPSPELSNFGIDDIGAQRF